MEACGANFSVEELESLSRMFSFEELQYRSSDILSSNLTVTDEALSGLHHNGIDCLTSFPCDHNYLLPSMEYQTFNEPSMDDYLSFFSQNDDVVTPCFPIHEDIIMNETLRMVNQENLKIAETGISDSYNEAWLKRKCIEKRYSEDDKSANNASENPSKKVRVAGNHQKNNKRAAQSRKNKKVMQSNEEDTIINSAHEEENIKKQSSSSCSVNDGEDSNIAISQESSLKSETKIRSLSSNGKARASRGSASDSQCLYARRRRERINERLRILQSLVPNGTKVDISTMLEEAVHYVKLLQLQIKLLSSDELWMYAPIAYNGIMETGMYQN